MAQRAVLQVNNNPVSEERSDEFQQWYSQVHIPQILERVPGVVSARMFAVDDASPQESEHRFLALYEIEADDLGQVMGALNQAMRSGELDTTDSMGRKARALLFREI